MGKVFQTRGGVNIEPLVYEIIALSEIGGKYALDAGKEDNIGKLQEVLSNIDRVFDVIHEKQKP